jgi:hypothetical protein
MPACRGRSAWSILAILYIIEVKNGLLINIGRTHITGTIGIVSAVKTRASYPYSLLVTFFRWFHLTQAIFA